MIHLDTSVLVHALTAETSSTDRFRQLLMAGVEARISVLTLYGWLRGRRTPRELALQEEFFPHSEIVTFDVAEAVCAAGLYQRVRRPRSREIDLAIAACAITHDAALWTLNPQDFKDIPGLALF